MSRLLTLAALGFLCVPALAGAQGVGFQTGLSIDPEQFFIGSHFESSPLIDRLHFRPSIDGGFGGGRRIAAINVDFVYRIPLERSAWTLYQGSGPVVAITRIGEDTDVSGGLGGVFGFAHANGFFGEFRVAGGGGPSLKFAVGFSLRR